MAKVLSYVQKSNTDIGIEDVVFSFEIEYEPFAAAGPAKMPKWWGPKFKGLWKCPENVNCIALSLVYAMNALKRPALQKRYAAREDQAHRDAQQLMLEMEWGKMVALQKLEDFVKVDRYKKLQVIVVTKERMTKKTDWIFTGEDFVPSKKTVGGVEYETGDNRLYLFYDTLQMHMAAYPQVQQLMRFIKNTSCGWCHACCIGWVTSKTIVHKCDGENVRRDIAKPYKQCKVCGDWGSDHKCPLVSCQHCKVKYKKNRVGIPHNTHRCVLWEEESEEERLSILGPGDPEDGKKTAMWVYDFESRIEKVQNSPRKIIRAFKRTADGRFPIADEFLADDNGLFPYEEGYTPKEDVDYQTDENGRKPWEYGYVGNESYSREVHDEVWTIGEKHVVNFVYCINWMTGEEKFFRPNLDGVDPLRQFMIWILEKNNGNNILAAHNGSGYDSRFLFYHAMDYFPNENVGVIMRGQKILEMKIGARTRKKCRFIDSLNHLPGSLKKLAKDFCKGQDGVADLLKGYFPHKFNTTENYGYVGKIPVKEMYDVYFGARDINDVNDFNAWWEAENSLYDGVHRKWNFMEQMETYNRNDVVLLGMIMKKVHDQSEVCPWFKITGPSFEHSRSLIANTILLKDEFHLDRVLRENGRAGYESVMNDIAMKESWAVLVPVEYAPVKKAFQGGRTEALAFHAGLTQEEIDTGVHYRAVDVVSMYPAQQIKQKYPVGVPTIRVWDEKFRPCRSDKCKNDLTRVKCYCRQEARGMNDVKHIVETGVVTARQILDEDWQGYVCVSIQPCKMMHPVLGRYDEERSKSVYSCEFIAEGWYDTNTLKVALKNGYKLDKVHAFHQYRVKDSLWRDRTSELFIGKLINGGDEPDDLEALARKYDAAFDEDFGDLIRGTRGKWGNRPAEKQVNKIRINCGWGKHAQAIRLDMTSILHLEDDRTAYTDLFNNATSGVIKMKSSRAFGQEKRMYTYTKQDDQSAPDLHGSYLPAAAWVPAYGRLQLWTEMDRVSTSNPGVLPRVVNLDTDSMYYKYYPNDIYPGVYNVEQGGLLGDWEREDFDEDNGGIVEFVGLAPKTYTFKCANGVVPKVKTKGVRLGYATEALVNFDTFKQLGQEMIANVKGVHRGGEEKRMRSLQVPQTNFSSKTDGVYTTRNYKRLAVNKLKDQKGDPQDNGYIKPYGYDEAPERVNLVGNWVDTKF